MSMMPRPVPVKNKDPLCSHCFRPMEKRGALWVCPRCGASRFV